jgi:2-methylcitrate dehydratase PrpD
MTDLSSAFADFLIDLRSAPLDQTDTDQLARLIFDYAVCAYSGSVQPSSVALRRWASRYDRSGKSCVIGGKLRVTPTVAALVNGTTAHSYELDDTHDATLSHPASVVMSAALAVAADVGPTGAEFLAAVVAGYEAMARIGLAANAGEVIEFGFHPTALFGAFGAATAACAIKKLPPETLLSAWGHALSLTAGSMQFSDETEGTVIKRIHAGYAAQQGVLAAEMAEAGIGAPFRAIDGKYGFLKLYARHSRPELLIKPSQQLVFHNISFKPYACCRQFHSVIDGLLEVTENIAPSDLTAIVVRGPRVLSDQHMLRRPTSPMAAQYSLPFVVGATLAFGPTNFDAFVEKNLGNGNILQWADTLRVEVDDDLQAQYPEHFGSEVEVTLADGSIRRKRVLDSRGTPANPFTWEHLKQKADGLIAGCSPPLALDRLQVTVRDLKEARTIKALQDLLAVDVVRRES